MHIYDNVGAKAVTENIAINNAGGMVYTLDEWDRLDRFLILGSEGNTYYQSAQQLTIENATCVKRLIKLDGQRVVKRVAEISSGGRAPKNDASIFALAMCLKLGDLETRRAAAEAVPSVCRIGTHIFKLANAVKALGGWGRLTNKAFANYYAAKDADGVAYDAVKYRQREGWTHKDLMRKSHVGKFDKDGNRNAVYKYMATGKPGTFSPKIIIGHELTKNREITLKQMVKLIHDYNLPREALPTEALRHKEVWEALLMSGKGMPLGAMVRNLGKMSNIGLLTPMSDASKYVAGRLTDASAYRRARLHPLAVLTAGKTYINGHGLRGSLTWTPDNAIGRALDVGFQYAFREVKPTGLNWLLALDVSGSMGFETIAGSSLTPREASAAMAMITANKEQWHHIIGFTAGSGRTSFGMQRRTFGGNSFRYGGRGTAVTELPISGSSLSDAIATVSNLPFGATDCAQPMIYAMENKLDVDAFVVYTDSETWAGEISPKEALDRYRQVSGRNAKLIVCGMTSTGFTIADPNDSGMLDVVGFDTAAPNIMANFAKGLAKND